MRQLMIFLLSATVALSVQGQQFRGISGNVVSASTHDPLPGASIKLKGGNAGVIADSEGKFSLTMPEGDQVLIVSFIGHQTEEVTVSGNFQGFLTIALHEDAAQLDEVVVSTGYYEIPKERATGSFTYISNELLNRSISSDIISRLEGVTSSLLFDRRGEGIVASSSALQLRVRGLSTIYANEAPLIVVNNFPYEGALQNINPNDVESITLLKDAAAASIWGARAGNGVIVITTKEGRLNQPLTISFNSNVTFQERPDLFYNPDFLSSEAFIETEQLLFERGFYDADINSLGYPVLSPVVELLVKERAGLISGEEVNEALSAWKREDVRRDAEKYLYRNGVHQQYALNVQGGTSKFQYYLSGGYDNNLTNRVGDNQERITLTATNTFRPFEKLEMTASIAYVQSKSNNNGLELYEIRPSSGKGTYPYAQLAGEDGNALPVAKDYSTTFIEQEAADGRNWSYQPLEEQRFNNNLEKSTEIRINTGLRYTLLDGLDAEARYLFQRSARRIRSVQDASSYDVRKLVNRYTQDDGTTIFPPGGILYNSQEEYLVHSGRLQLNYNKKISEFHRVSAVAGTEIRQAETIGDAFQLYGYDDEVLHIAVPESAEIHKTAGIVYDRSNDGDFKVVRPSAIARLYNRKRDYYSEAIVYPALTMDDFKPELFHKARNLIRRNNAEHPWLDLSDEQMLVKAGLYRHDTQTRQSGYNLAAALLFGKDETILGVLPHYKIDALLRRENVRRYDDRMYIQCNLIEAYDQLMEFVTRHLPDRFYLQGDQRISLRSRIFREVTSNLLIHREYRGAHPATFTIYRDRVEVINANNPHGNGLLLPDQFVPFPKNPLIAKFFVQLGHVDELGSGILNVFEYLKAYTPGTVPKFIENHLFETIIPLACPTYTHSHNDAVNDAVNGDASKAVKARLADELKIIAQGGLSLAGIMSRFNIQRATAQRDMKLLKQASFIEFRGSCKTGTYVPTAKTMALFP